MKKFWKFVKDVFLIAVGIAAGSKVSDVAGFKSKEAQFVSKVIGGGITYAAISTSESKGSDHAKEEGSRYFRDKIAMERKEKDKNRTLSL